MKRIVTICAFLSLAINLFAQSPEKMSYQAVIRDGSDNLLTSTSIGMQISVLQGSINGSTVYVETQQVSSNTNGLVSLEIGNGTVVSGDFTTIDWENGPYFIKTETDPLGGTNYTITGTTQLLSVPYALYAKTSGSSTPGPQGAQGPAGATGPQGPQGPAGNGIASTTDNGDGTLTFTYDDASTFVTPDLSGPQGAQGPAGATGPQGAQGPQGVQGVQGPAGTTGPTGPQGPAGNGIASTTDNGDGTFTFTYDDASTFVTSDLTGPQGAQGPAGATGPQGPQGPQGVQGAVGPQGPAGPSTEVQAGTNVTVTGDGSAGNPYVVNSTGGSGLTAGTDVGEMLFWNGTAWVAVEPPTTTDATLKFVYGEPQWVGGIALAVPVTNPASGQTWLDRNLGALRVAQSINDPLAYGDLFQWGRLADGHEDRTSATNSNLSATDVPLSGDFITNTSDWRSSPNNSLWQGVNGINNPCPSGYRLPTEAEWTAEMATWSTNDLAGAFSSPLGLGTTGFRRNTTGAIENANNGGWYWSSTVAGNSSRSLRTQGTPSVNNTDRGFGLAVRCIQD